MFQRIAISPALAALLLVFAPGCAEDDKGSSGGEEGGHPGEGGVIQGEGEGESDEPRCIPNNNGVEICNGLDDDCNLEVDDVSPELTQLKNDHLNCGACGNRCQAANADPRCVNGLCDFTCSGGWSDIDGLPDNGCEVQCVATNGGDEECDGVDNDCDQEIDEDFDFYNDPAHCGGCHQGCDLQGVLHHVCEVGDCLLGQCAPGFQDLDGDGANGCEYPCIAVGDEVEVCDGADNDCYGLVDADDDDLAPPNFACANLGVCAGVEPQCGGGRWFCDYPEDEYQPDGELLCDGNDNDCDGSIDEDFVGKGQDCFRGNGACADRGVWECTRDRRALRCTALERPERANIEICDGVDNDCDGQVDNDVVDLEWVQVGDIRMYKYEGSRPDANPVNGGNLGGRACSRPGVVPWSRISYDEARVACSLGGWRLCTLGEWQLACGGPARTRFPYSNDFDRDACNGLGRQGPDGEIPAEVVPSGDLEATCSSGFDAVDMSGNLKEWTGTPVGALDNPAHMLVGGAFDNFLPESLSCDLSAIPRGDTFRFLNLGFRCCQDPSP